MHTRISLFKDRRLCWVSVIGAIVIAFIAGALWRGAGDAHHHDATEAGQPDARSAGPRMYYCSMHPQVRSPDPNDKCPICFMDLIPVPDDDNGGDDETDTPRLRLSASAAALMDIRTLPVERRETPIDVKLFGKVDFDESRLYNVPARTDAYIEQLLINTPWHPVAKGGTIAEFYSPAAVTAMRELLVAGSETTLDASRGRLRRMGVTAQQIAEIEQSGTAPRTFRVESPVDGVMLDVTARAGDFLREGALLTRIADITRVWVNLEAYERDLPWLATGQAAHFEVAGLPGEVFEGTVSFVDPVINPRTRTARLRVEADNPDALLKPGMYASAVIHAAYGSDTDQPSTVPLVIPATAPLITGRRALVYVRVPDQDRPTFEPRRITLGPRAGDHYIVLQGLEDGELVVVNGQFKIDSELQIRGRPSMMAPDGGAPPTHDHARADHGEHAHQTDTPRFQTECPVMGGAINPDLFVDAEGYRLYVCCPGCDKTILENPKKYIEDLKTKGITPYRLQTHCPIMDLPVNKELYHDHEGQRIYICCPGCLGEVKERADEIIKEHRQRGIVFEKHEN